MEFKTLLEKRRSVRKFAPTAVPSEVVDRLLAETLGAPSSRNSRSTRLLVVDDPEVVARMASMRDYGSAFMKGAPLAIVVLGDTACSDLWRINAAISATVLHLACVDEGLASCWVHIDGRPRLKAEPQGGVGGRLSADVPPHSRGVRTALRAGHRLFGLRAGAAARGRRQQPHHPPLSRGGRGGRGGPGTLC